MLLDYMTAEQPALREMLGRACEAVEVFLTEGLEPAMNRYNGSPKE